MGLSGSNWFLASEASYLNIARGHAVLLASAYDLISLPRMHE